MSPRLPRLTSKQFIKILRAHGWEVARVTGSHHIMAHPRTKGIISVPQHNRTMSIGTLSRLVKDAGLTADDLH